MVASSRAPVAPAPTAGTEAWLSALAGAALPTRRQEDWRFTDLSALQNLPQCLAAPATSCWDLETLPAGISRLSAEAAAAEQGRSLAATGCSEHWPVRLNAGADPALLALRVSGCADPLELLWQAGAGEGLRARRLLLVLEPGASLDLFLLITAAGPQALSLVIEVAMATDSRLNFGSLAIGKGGQATLLAHTAIRQASGSQLKLVNGSSGWALLRQEPRLVQTDGAAHACLRGLQLVDGEQVADTHSHVCFEGPAGSLDQLHKVVADDRGRSVFNGAVQVPRVAQQTNAAQLSRNLLLSDRARIDTKPELEIVADDVKCAHGATVSRLQREELFYLQSRGIAAAQAAALLKRGFCEEVLRELPAAAARHRPLQSLLGEA
ncbi:Fe-S cluster assembly protein SufD [Cyanobium sp. LEGE 06143]|uniref:Fe-S cluster assembly protein SufD n=1 Tax=Cyanobium sp. LEGE 06143 TaxID=945727 RepID=UPI001882C11E|nr:Fe-S cluster assembly protein SufD [Cyanobium sp. LEGE 06143]MBE9172289.1 Fe-S cluster assembly protein SufD [Cyanobium sp. LEGE 06143]